MEKINYKITTTNEDLKEGLFGQIVLFIYEILPFLYAESIFPEWDIKSKLYGTPADHTIIPGAFDIAYTSGSTLIEEIKLRELRENHTSVLGGDWVYMHRLWHTYFKIPSRIISRADGIGDLSNSLGIHYRGTDKSRGTFDSNPVSYDEYITLISDFISTHDSIKSIFVATDEFEFVKKIKQHFISYQILNLGKVDFHLRETDTGEKADRAVLDCLLLSRCKYVVMTTSALSGFSKILNPNLECYRVTASRLFTDIPYFPIAYIPRLTTSDTNCLKILKKLYKGDWIENKKANRKFNHVFQTKKRHAIAVKHRKVIALLARTRNLIYQIAGSLKTN